jgi:hypothetical protein
LARTLNAEVCNQFADAVVEEMTCRTSLACGSFSNPADTTCVAQSRALLDRFLAGHGLCLHGRVPVVVPPEWECQRFFFAGQDGCDCGCGVVDPDCDAGGCMESGCTEPACTYCYVDGMDVGCDTPIPDGGHNPPVPTPDAGTQQKSKPGCSDAAPGSADVAGWALGVILASFLLGRGRSWRRRR